MKRLALPAGLLALLTMSAGASARSELDETSGGLRLPTDALRTWSFESADALAGLELTSWTQGSGAFPELDHHPLTTAAEVATWLTTDPADAVEGAHALRLGKDRGGIAIVDPALFAQVADGRVETLVWARAETAAPQLYVVYSSDPNGGIDPLRSAFAAVRAVRTGRETTDGWAELSTGPIDGSVWGVPIRAILVVPSPFADTTSFLVDALELRRAKGKPMAPNACTQENVDTVCGERGDCMFGHCVPSEVSWGPLPPPAHRKELTERWVHFVTHYMGDRNAIAHADDFAATVRGLAGATSPRHFFGGLVRAVNLLRDNHTSFGSPANFTNFSPQVTSNTSSALGACFGVVEKDIVDGGLGFAVFRNMDTPLTGVPLKRGDLITAIDGRDPKAWADDVWPRYASTMPNDPASDASPIANALARLIATRASTITLLRCESSGACDEQHRQTITIDVAKVLYEALRGGRRSSGSFACSQRLIDAVPSDASASTDQGGEDPVSSVIGEGGETRVQFDGFVGQSSWQTSMSDVFSARPARVLMDARMGHGGYYQAVEHLFDLLRGTKEPMAVISVARGGYDVADTPSLLPNATPCANKADQGWGCVASGAAGIFATETDPVGAATRIAWLNAYDVSANDFMPRLLKGRSNVRILAPHPTSGAFGAIASLPALSAGWMSGSMQVQDSRFAPDADAMLTARWESGHGVEPDEVVVQKLSHAIDGVDTLLQAATAWLATP